MFKIINALVIVLLFGCTSATKKAAISSDTLQKIVDKNKPKRVFKKHTATRSIASLDDKVSNLDPNKKTVCTITINSKDEREVFQQALPNFNFIELTDAGDDNDGDDWMDESCQSGVKCDVLVVSGHFGGEFFGDSGKTLSMEKLEALSCTNSCEGILNNPKEVFLFGCNTLAGKAKDHRSPEAYIRVLVEDGFSELEAQQIAAFRYSPVGPSFHNRMSRAFSSVEKIYGFDSVGPAGQNVRHMLVDYFKRLPDYEKHLSEVSAEKSNTNWTKSLAVTSQEQAAGSLDKMSSSACMLMSDNVTEIQKLAHINEILDDESKLLESLPFISYYLDQIENGMREYTYNSGDEKILELSDSESKSLEQKSILNPSYYTAKFKKSASKLESFFKSIPVKIKDEIKKAISTNANAKATFDKYLRQDIPGMLQIRATMLEISDELNIFSKDEITSYRNNLIGDLKAANVPRERAELICTMDLEIPGLTIDAFYSGEWDVFTMWAVGCLEVKDIKISEKVYKQLNSRNDSLNRGALFILRGNEYSTEKVLRAIKLNYEKAKNKALSEIDVDIASDLYDEVEDAISLLLKYKPANKAALQKHLAYVERELVEVSKNLADFKEKNKDHEYAYYLDGYSPWTRYWIYHLVNKNINSSESNLIHTVINQRTAKDLKPYEERSAKLIAVTTDLLLDSVDCTNFSNIKKYEEGRMAWFDEEYTQSESGKRIRFTTVDNYEVEKYKLYMRSISTTGGSASIEEYKNHISIIDDLEKKCSK